MLSLFVVLLPVFILTMQRLLSLVSLPPHSGADGLGDYSILANGPYMDIPGGTFFPYSIVRKYYWPCQPIPSTPTFK